MGALKALCRHEVGPQLGCECVVGDFKQPLDVTAALWSRCRLLLEEELVPLVRRRPFEAARNLHQMVPEGMCYNLRGENGRSNPQPGDASTVEFSDCHYHGTALPVSQV